MQSGHQKRLERCSQIISVDYHQLHQILVVPQWWKYGAAQERQVFLASCFVSIWQAEYSGGRNDWTANMKHVEGIFRAILVEPTL